MAFQLSPGVNVSEIDLTTVVPSVATTIGGLTGAFSWGPANEITIINNEAQLAVRFGKPDANTYETFFTAANFLSYGSDLRVVRSVGATAKNATANSSATTVLIENESDYEGSHSSNTASIFNAKWAGALGNSIKVSITDSLSNTTLYSAWEYSGEFDSIPATSDWASERSSANDEMHIIVLDATGLLSTVIPILANVEGPTTPAGVRPCFF